MRTAHALEVNVEAAVLRWGLERTGFLTLTFADLVTDPVEAQRRMNSLTTHVIRPRYGEAIRVMERQKSGRIHYHLLVPLQADIRTGFDFRAVEDRDYRSASPALRSEWAFWRETAKKYGFGRTELLPIKSTAQAIGRYVGKYIAKHLGVRDERDLGCRLVSYVGPRVATVKFAWSGGRGRSWRVGLGSLVHALYEARQIHRPTVDAMSQRYGKRWAWKWRDVVRERAAAIEGGGHGEICGGASGASSGAVAGGGSASEPERSGEASREVSGVCESALRFGGAAREVSEATQEWGRGVRGLVEGGVASRGARGGAKARGSPGVRRCV